MLELYVGNTPITIQRARFPGGETLIRLPKGCFATENHSSVIVNMNFQGNDDLIDLMLLVDAVRREWRRNTGQPLFMSLHMPYLPYARQDRVCTQGESLSLKVIADLINSLKFDRVLCRDIHSDVGIALLENLYHHTLDGIADDLRALGLGSDNKTLVLVSPDVGASKKIENFARANGYTQVVQAEKKRDVQTGLLTGFKVHAEEYEDYETQYDFLIIDDICDGGGTFIGLAAEIRKVTKGRILLYVSHGIFSKGLDIFNGVLDQVITSNNMSGIKEHPLLKVIR